MRLIDLIRLVFENLGRRKARVALTAIGVVIGTAAVVILVSLAIGLQKNATEQLYGIGDLTLIQVSPTYGGEFMGGGAGGGMVDFGSSSNIPETVLLTTQTLREIRAIPGVVEVIPRDYLMASVIIKHKNLEGSAGVISIEAEDIAILGLSAMQGDTSLKKGEIIIGSQVANNFYDPHARPGKEPPPPPELYGQSLQFIFMKWDTQGNEVRKNAMFKVVGVLAESSTEADWSIYMRMDDAKPYNEWARGQKINYNKEGYGMAVVKAEDVSQALEISKQIQAMGLQAYTPQSIVESINSFYVILQFIFGGVGATALLVAAIGIANTMAMAILERTREIGLMKAIGATNREILAIFIGEAAGIGFLGGLAGTLLGWLAGQAINVIALVYLANQSTQQGGMVPSIAVYTPLWLPIFSLFFATLIGLLSGLYPALRAATMIPVLALKYE